MIDLSAPQDLVQSRVAMALLWLLPTAVILLTGQFADIRWVITAGWTGSLLVMGTACFVNARGCERMYCYFTGPFFLIMAAVSLLYGLQVLPFGARGWTYIGAVLLVGSVALCVLPERLWGRYRRAPQEDGS